MRRWLYVHLATLLVLPAFLIGGVHLPTQLGMALWAGLFVSLVTLRVAKQEPHKQRIILGGWVWLFGGALVFTFLQWLPWPSFLLSWFSPQTDLVYHRILGPWGLYGKGQMMPLSLAPGDTAAKLIYDLSALAIFVGVLQWARSRRHLRFIMQLSVVAASLLCCLTLAQTALRMDRPLLGLYNPVKKATALLQGAPFINENHLGGYVLFHGLLGLVLFFLADDNRKRALWGTCVGLLSLTVLLSLSRGAIVAYACGLLAFWWVVRTTKREEKEEEEEETHEARYKRRRKSRKRENPPVFQFLLALLLVVGVVGMNWGLEKVAREFSDFGVNSRRNKIRVVYEFSAPLIAHYPVFGVGRGAMAMGWHRFSSPRDTIRGQKTVTHAESILTQPLIDWGVLFGLLFLGLGGWFLWTMWRDTRGNFVLRGMMVALGALLLQNFVDFNLEFPGVGFPFLVVLAAVRRHQLQAAQNRKRYALYWPAGVGLVVLLASSLLATYAFEHHYRYLPKRWKSDVVAKAGPDSGRVEAYAKALLVHHPSDYVLPMHLAKHHLTTHPWNPTRALTWLESAAFLNPSSAEVMMMRSYILSRLKLFALATRELSHSVELQPRLLPSAVRTIQRYKFVEVALKKTTSYRIAEALLYRYRNGKYDPETMQRYADLVRTRFPKKSAGYAILFELFSLKLRKKKPANLPAFFAHWGALLRQLQKNIPPSQVSFWRLAQGNFFLYQNKLGKAGYWFKKVLEHPNQRYHWKAYLGYAAVLSRRKEEKELLAWIHQARMRFHLPWMQASLHHQEGLWYERHFEYQKAMLQHSNALRIRPLVTYRLALARTCEELSMYRCSMRNYRILLRQGKGHRIKQKLKALQKKLQRSRVPLP